MAATCEICGCPDPQLEGLGPFATVSLDSYAELRALFSGELDDYTCVTEHRTPGLRPTVYVPLQDGNAMLCWGTRAATQPKSRQRFIEDYQKEGAQLTLFDSLDELEVSLAHNAADMLSKVIRAHDRIRKSEAKVGVDWRDFPSAFFACSALVLSMPLPGVGIQLPKGVSTEDVFEVVVNVQVMTWLGLCGSWSGKLDAERTLEGDLSAYFATAAMIHKAAEEFLRVTEDRSHWTPPGRFCVEMLRASIYAARERSNPDIKQWADLFLRQEVLVEMGDEEMAPLLRAMRISPDRARETIPYEALFNACARWMAEIGIGCLEVLEALGERLGYPGLAVQLAHSFRALPGSKKVPAAKIVSALADVARKRKQPDAVWRAASGMIDVVDGGPTVESLTAIADGLLKELGDTAEMRARADAWLCAQLLKRRFIQAALERVGDLPRNWENDVPLHELASLWTERSNALRVAGRREEATAVLEGAIKLLEEHGHEPSPQLRRNLGILYQEAGRQEEALAIFHGLLDKADRELSLLLRQSIGITYLSLQRFTEARKYLEEALALAKGPLAEYRPRLQASLSALRSIGGDRAGALEALRSTAVDTIDDASVLIPYASAWINACQDRDLLEPEDGERLSNLVQKLAEAQKSTLELGDMQTFVHVNRLLAILSDLTPGKIEGRELFWELLDKSARDFEGAPDAHGLLGLARANWVKDRARARALLLELPVVAAKRFGPERDPTLKVDSLNLLRRWFDELGSLAIRTGPMEDMRLVAEAQRDLFSRIAAANAGGEQQDGEAAIALDDHAMARISGPTAVLEWLDTGDGVVGLMTLIGVDGTASMSDLGDPGVDLDELADRIQQRLSVWHPGRKGDPFDLPEWTTFTDWLQQTLAGRLPDGGQLVVIEHEEVWGLQWHVAAAPRWRTCYASGWTALLNGGSSKRSQDPIGVAMVTKFHEAPQVLDALKASLARTRSMARSVRRKCRAAIQDKCDRAALSAMFENCAVVKVLCHGYVEEADKQVALMLADGGALPLADSVAAATPEGQRHRFGWQECAALRRAPQVVFSAACSSGQAHPAGLGERLGLFSGLRRAGTRTFVAPRWNIRPADVLPILDEAMDRYVRSAMSPADAVYSACLEASKSQPRWIAWALALEGDWK
jgi:tetratricopeptide (TPR) repeat protein